jgi:predicted nucleic acid-binding protein
MKIMLDTSVLVPAMVRQHPRHARAFAWLERVARREHVLFVAAHSLAELHAVLTTLPIRPRITPSSARRLIAEDVLDRATIVPLTPEDYIQVLNSMAELDHAGGVVYDALCARAAEIAAVERLLTFNADDFRAVWPAGADVIAEP